MLRLKSEWSNDKPYKFTWTKQGSWKRRIRNQSGWMRTIAPNFHSVFVVVCIYRRHPVTRSRSRGLVWNKWFLWGHSASLRWRHLHIDGVQCFHRLMPCSLRLLQAAACQETFKIDINAHIKRQHCLNIYWEVSLENSGVTRLFLIRCCSPIGQRILDPASFADRLTPRRQHGGRRQILFWHRNWCQHRLHAMNTPDDVNVRWISVFRRIQVWRISKSIVWLMSVIRPVIDHHPFIWEIQEKNQTIPKNLFILISDTQTFLTFQFYFYNCKYSICDPNKLMILLLLLY